MKADIVVKKKITTSTSKLVILESYYALSLYIYINKNITSDTLFLLGANIYSDTLFEQLENIIVYDNKRAAFSLFERIWFGFGVVPARFKSIKSIVVNFDDVYCHDHLPIALLLIKHKYTVIEDGLANYLPYGFIRGILLKIMDLLGMGFQGFGRSHRAIQIYLTGMKEVPNEIYHKVYLLDKDDFIASIPAQLNGHFSLSIDDDHQEEFSILLTQPISEDRAVSESYKLEIYKYMVSTIGGRFYIKPHPRELTNYNIVFADFDNVVVLPRHCLFEGLCGLEGGRVVTLFSSAGNELLNHSQGKSVFVGTSFNEGLSSRFGHIPSSGAEGEWMSKELKEFGS